MHEKFYTIIDSHLKSDNTYIHTHTPLENCTFPNKKTLVKWSKIKFTQAETCTISCQN